MATKAETFRADEERRPKKNAPSRQAKQAEKPERTDKRSERARSDASALHAAENEKSSPKQRATDAKAKTIRVRGKARG